MTGPPTELDAIPLQQHKVLSRRGEHVGFIGQKIGTRSSRRDQHTHPGIEFAPAKYQCSACRWFEPSLWIVDPDSDIVRFNDKDVEIEREPATGKRRYVYQSSGMSAVPNEVERAAVYVFATPAEVVRAMTIVNRTSEYYIPEASIELLNVAADILDEFDELYDNLVDPLDRRHKIRS